ncbi:MAG: hypothetical protein ABI534_11315 [Chloroflexota bacterium]
MHAHRHRSLAAALTALLVLTALPTLTLAVPPDGPPGQGLAMLKAPKVEVTLEGSIGSTTDENGRVSYTLAVDDVTYELSAGPRWYWREENPLEPFVGQTVTVQGLTREGSTEVDVRRVNDVEIRGEGRPPWAGGWKRVGALYPGWSADKAERFAQKFGDCFPPGQCKPKDANGDGADAEASPAG